MYPIRRVPFVVIVILVALLLSVAVTYAQVTQLGVHFLRVQQEKVHAQMLDGRAGNPWQYRILADWMLEPVIRLASFANIDRPAVFSFIAFRFLQCALILIAAAFYYRKLGLGLYANLIGLSILAWGMSYSLYNSDLSFNVFFDVAFYLLAAIFMFDGRFLWLALLMIAAALNRETSLLIPFMLVLLYYFDQSRTAGIRPALIAAVGSLLVYGIVFAFLRFHYGQQPFLTADGYYPGLGLLVLNLQRQVTWQQLLITLGIIPLLAIFAYREWPVELRIFFWVVAPVWVVVHFLAALVAETRLLLVPQALVFIPGALLGLRREPKDSSGDSVNT